MQQGDTVKYRYKLQKKHPECKPQGVWDFITFRYYLRCPKANSITAFLYKVNLCGIGFLVILIGIAVLFMTLSIDLSRCFTGSLRYLPFFPVLVSGANIILGVINSEQKLGLKYYVRYWVIADCVGVLVGILVYIFLKKYVKLHDNAKKLSQRRHWENRNFEEEMRKWSGK